MGTDFRSTVVGEKENEDVVMDSNLSDCPQKTGLFTCFLLPL